MLGTTRGVVLLAVVALCLSRSAVAGDVPATAPMLNGTISDIVAFGKAAWAVVRGGVNVQNPNTDWIAAVPRGVSVGALAGFVDYHWGGFGWKFTNALGQTTVDFRYSYTYACMGNYQGHGMFLANTGVTVDKINAYFGYSADVNITASSPVNYGSVAEPIAGMNLEVTIDVGTLVQHTVLRQLISVHGDCSAKKL